MEIVVTHLTRMAAPHICVAGLRPVDEAFIRPVRSQGRLDASDLRAQGGPFALGSHLHLGEVVPRPSPPENEDVVVTISDVRALGQLTESALWALLEDSAERSVAAIFGADLERDGNTASVAIGSGDRSLGHLRPRNRPLLEISYGKPRVRLNDADLGPMRLPITDLRLFDPQTGRLQERAVHLLADRLRRREVVLAVGLTRPWAREDENARHWLQINNIHLDDDPLWLG